MEITEIPVEYLRLSPLRPMRSLPRPTAATVRNIQRFGITIPVLVRPIASTRPEHYEILAGEDHWLGAQQAGLHEVPVCIRRDLSNAAAEQIVRLSFCSPGFRLLEEAEAAKSLVEQGLTVTEVAKRSGKNRTAVAHLLRLLQLCRPVKDLLATGRLKYGHARPLVGLTPEQQHHLAKHILARGLSVRKVEHLARQLKTQSPTIAALGSTADRKSPEVVRLEQRLGEQVGSPISITCDQQGRGQLVINFQNLEILQGILERLGYDG